MFGSKRDSSKETSPDSGALPSLTPTQEAEIRNRVEAARKRPLVTAVMGQTGVGKSSLINALFGTSLRTNAVAPETKEPQLHKERNQAGDELWFWDMPGIGESEAADARYLQSYGEKILEADVALWLIHADTRSVSFDIQAIARILQDRPNHEQSKMLSKLSFVLSKCDLVAPEPWVIGKRGATAILDAPEETERLLNEKASYFQRALTGPWSELIVARTHHSGGLPAEDGQLRTDRSFAYFHGIMSAQERDDFSVKYPNSADAVRRLYQNSQVVYCSSKFRYNLLLLMSILVEKLEGGASLRFRKFVSANSKLNEMSWNRAAALSNVMVFDMDRGETSFDLRRMA